MRVDNTIVQPQPQTDIPDVHNVTILDGSGSMSGSKYDNACKGILLDFNTCKNEGFKSFTFVEFNSANSITTHCFMSPFDVKLKFNGPNGGTPLYQTIGQTLERLLKEVSKEDKVLVKVFTDGEHNEYYGKYSTVEELKPLIVTCESKGYTITFIGTAQDTNRIVRNLGLDASNTLVHDNTGEGVKMSFQTQAFATTQYRKSLEEGEDVSRGFYSKVLND
jgi:hypothetical protein